MTQIFGEVMVKPNYVPNRMVIRLNNFLYIFNLRQGTIFIAVHQIALSSFILVVLLVGISHVNEMLEMLHKDMADEYERRGFYEIAYGEQMVFHEANGVNSNNQKQFSRAQKLAAVTVILLYTSTLMVSIYLVCCISLFYGAAKYKKDYIVPWIFFATFGVILLVSVVIVGDKYETMVQMCGGHYIYRIGCAVCLFGHIYCIFTVASFLHELNQASRGTYTASLTESTLHLTPDYGTRGECVLLLEGGQSNIISSTRNPYMRRFSNSQFV